MTLGFHDEYDRFIDNLSWIEKYYAHYGKSRLRKDLAS